MLPILATITCIILGIHGHGHHQGVTIGLTPYSHPVLSQYHAQDHLGQYSYGYATPTATKSETKTIDGVTQGGYSYIDSNGFLQSVSYVADPVHGFRVAATNLPQDLPDVAYAKAKHLADFEAIKNEHARARYAIPHAIHNGGLLIQNAPLQPVQDLPEVVRARAEHLAAFQAALVAQQIYQPQAPAVVQDLPEVVKARAEHLAAVEQIKARDAAINLSPVHLHNNVAPVHYHSGPYLEPAYIHPVPVPAPAPVARIPVVRYQPIVYHPIAPTSQYHAQDGLGQYTYGYTGPLSSKSETKSADGVTRGGYSYIDANGILQTVHYVADSLNGFRVAATNLPH